MANAYERHDISDELGVGMPGIIVNLSMPCFGFCALERLGETYRRAMAIGKTPTSVFVVGAIKEFGSDCWKN